MADLGVLAASVVFMMPAALAAGPGGCQPQLVAQLAVRLLGLHPVLLAGINGTEMPLVMDTGSSIDMLTYASAGKLHLRWRGIGRHTTVAGVGGESSSLTGLTRADLKLGEVHLAGAEFVVTGADVGSAAGVIGRRFLDKYDIDYDLRQGSVRLLNAGGCIDELPPDWSALHASVVEISENGSVPTAIGYINDTEIRISFDTGAGTSLLDTRAAARAALSKDTPGAAADADASGVGRHSLQTWLVPVRSLKIGDEQVRNTRLRMGHLALNDADMVLGTDFFLSHRVYIANSRRRIYFFYYGGPVFASSPTRKTSP